VYLFFSALGAGIYLVAHYFFKGAQVELQNKSVGKEFVDH